MGSEHHKMASTPCLCNALRRASRAVSRLYDEELRGTGLRTTQYSLLSLLGRVGEIRQRELSGQTLLDETTLTRALRSLVAGGWVAVRARPVISCATRRPSASTRGGGPARECRARAASILAARVRAFGTLRRDL